MSHLLSLQDEGKGQLMANLEDVSERKRRHPDKFVG